VGLHPLFTLGPRLQLCASMVRKNVKLADVGTDHAYLPIWLAKKAIISNAVAADIRQGPLEKAKDNIQRYHVQDTVTARLSDGLNKISPNEADDIVIAGMGGEMINKIIENAKWLKDSNKRLILQPMTSVPELRKYLAENGFALLKEQAVIDENHAYTVILSYYNPKLIKTDELYEYIGMLNPKKQADREYVSRVLVSLSKKARGMEISGKNREAQKLYNIIDNIKSKV
jgi:tRNA (adenine22-N1)-methyltransferase